MCQQSLEALDVGHQHHLGSCYTGRHQYANGLEVGHFRAFGKTIARDTGAFDGSTLLLGYNGLDPIYQHSAGPDFLPDFWPESRYRFSKDLHTEYGGLAPPDSWLQDLETEVQQVERTEPSLEGLAFLE